MLSVVWMFVVPWMVPSARMYMVGFALAVWVLRVIVNIVRSSDAMMRCEASFCNFALHS